MPLPRMSGAAECCPPPPGAIRLSAATLLHMAGTMSA